MNAEELYTRLRVDLDDVALPYLWSSGELYSYLDSAQKTFCRLTQGIPDTIPLPLVTDSEWYPRDKRILKIRGATRLRDNIMLGRPVRVIDYATQANECGYFDSRSGPVSDLVDSQRKGFLRAYPIPNHGATIELSVFRLPNTIEDGSDDELEVDEMHHLFLIDGAMMMAYRKHDADTLDKTKAAEAEARFRGYCAESKQQQERNEFQPGTVRYGGL